MSTWLAVVGIGEEGIAGLGASARAEIDAAQVLVGGARHLAMVPGATGERIEWPKPFSVLPETLRTLAGRQVCVLATGDPFCFGVGSSLARHFAAEEMRVYPAPSCFSLACARLGWSLEDVETVSVHGRPLALFRAAIAPGARVLAIAHDGDTPARLAQMLVESRYEESRMVVLEHLGGKRERIRETRAGAFDLADVAAMNTVAVDCAKDPSEPALTRVPGLPDDAFRHDGQLTKRVVRAATIAALRPVRGERLWDVGAGCGSIGIEWMRCAPGAHAIAIERDASRAALVEENRDRLGVPSLVVVRGEAPDALAGLDAPDAVFVGGGVASHAIVDACWDALAPGGRLVANAVTLEGEHALADRHAAHGGDLARIAVSHAERIGAYTAMRPAMPVTQLVAIKR